MLIRGCGHICPLPLPSPEAGEGVPVPLPAYLNSALGKCRVRCPFLGKSRSHSVRLAVPEKIFALLACSIFSTAADAPPRCICHRQCSAPHPTHRDPLASKSPTISQTRKLFVKVCANWALSLQIPLVSSGLVRGASLTGKYLPHSDLCRRSLSSFAFPIFPRARLYARGISIQPKGGRRFVPCCPRGGGKNHLPFR